MLGVHAAGCVWVSVLMGVHAVCVSGCFFFCVCVSVVLWHVRVALHVGVMHWWVCEMAVRVCAWVCKRAFV